MAAQHNPNGTRGQTISRQRRTAFCGSRTRKRRTPRPRPRRLARRRRRLARRRLRLREDEDNGAGGGGGIDKIMRWLSPRYFSHIVLVIS
jgi:hypothetical protein